MLISTHAGAGHRTCVRSILAAIDVEAVLVLGEDDSEVRSSLRQRFNVDRLELRRGGIDSIHLLRRSIRTRLTRAGLIWTGLHEICQHHLRIGITVRTCTYTKRTQSTMRSSR